jgi:hypothetical protein
MGDATKTEDPWYPDDSGEWVEYDGSGMPVAGHIRVLILLVGERAFRDAPASEDLPASAADWSWPTLPIWARVVAYRLMEDRT